MPDQRLSGPSLPLPLAIPLQAIPPAPALLFHMKHSKAYSREATRAWHKADLKFKQTFEGFSVRPDAAITKLKVYNTPGWGMQYEDLPEIYI